MPRDLTISIGQHSDKGAKESNQDFHGALIPQQPALHGQRPDECPVAARMCGEILSLPLHPALRDDEVDEIAAAVQAFQPRTVVS